MNRLVPIAFACSLAASSALADPRIRDVAYDAGTVISLAGCPGFQSTVVFGDNERIENIAMGDGNLWQAVPNKRSDLLFLKPVHALAHTNMMVVTDRHRYSFELSTRTAVACRTGQVVYDLRLTYPAELQGPQTPPPLSTSAAAAPLDAPPPPSVRNTAYTFAGATANVPVRVFDDGKSTWLKWADGVSAPAIYSLGPDKSEVLVNYAVKGDYIVVDGVMPALVLRRGVSVATLYNDAYQTPKLDEAAPQPRGPIAAAPAPAKPSLLSRLFSPSKEVAQ